MQCIDSALYSLKKKVLEEIILNYAKEYSNKKIRLSGKNKPDLVNIIISYNIEVDCKKYLSRVFLVGGDNHGTTSYDDIERQFAALASRVTV
tara:strand:- start:2562 stop:2837 length:276 start_codon:yes stop_codon:yes gene_type:complete